MTAKMRGSGTTLTALWLAAACLTVAAQQQDPPPIEIDKTERAEVRLVLLDTVVVDADGSPVAGLQKEDFEIRYGGEALTPDVLETRCEQTGDGVQAAAGRNETRKLILAFDYLHMPQFHREWALDTAIEMIEKERLAGDEVMVAALTGGLRIEQPFTGDPDAVIGSLKRMQKDVSLWNGNFAHANETGFVRSITTLFDVLARTSVGPKAVVLYSAMEDVPLDKQFERIAGVAATSRSALYTVDPYGLKQPDLGLDAGSGTAPAAAPG